MCTKNSTPRLLRLGRIIYRNKRHEYSSGIIACDRPTTENPTSLQPLKRGPAVSVAWSQVLFSSSICFRIVPYRARIMCTVKKTRLTPYRKLRLKLTGTGTFSVAVIRYRLQTEKCMVSVKVPVLFFFLFIKLFRF